ncbi:hypothetical protein PGB90_002716 [Kerria lacca]
MKARILSNSFSAAPIIALLNVVINFMALCFMGSEKDGKDLTVCKSDVKQKLIPIYSSIFFEFLLYCLLLSRVFSLYRETSSLPWSLEVSESLVLFSLAEYLVVP